MKCLNNLVTAINFLAVVEALAIGKRAGLDPAAMVDVLDQSTGMSWISQTHIRQRVISRSFDDPFKLALMLKDIGIAMELARSATCRRRSRRSARSSGAPPGSTPRPRRASASSRAGSSADQNRDQRRRRARLARRTPSADLAMNVLVTGADGLPRQCAASTPCASATASSPPTATTATSPTPEHARRTLRRRPFDRVFHLAAHRQRRRRGRLRRRPARQPRRDDRPARALPAQARRGGPVGALRLRELDRRLRHAAAGAHRRRHARRRRRSATAPTSASASC